MMERHNRKSHLAPQLSPATQALLRGESISSPAKESAASKTPTSGEIPIAGEDVKSSPPSEQPAVQRVYSADINGGPIYPTQSSNFDRAAFPPRTSSTFPRENRPRESEGRNSVSFQSSRHKESETFNLPIRPAPPASGPPSGPLPPPPTSSLRYPSSRRQATNGISYSANEGAHF